MPELIREMSDSILIVKNVGKSFFGVRVLHNVNLTLGRGEICGLVGENGAGKSTLMNILGGLIAADSGNIRLWGEAYAPKKPAAASAKGIAFIHQELNLFPNLSIAENLCLGTMPRRRFLGIPFVDRRSVRAQAQSLLAGVDLHVDPNTLVEDLSLGERQLVEIAKAVGANAKLVIFDEPTTSLTIHETERLFAIIERLRGQGISMIYISHTLSHVVRLCDRIVVLRDGEVVGTGSRETFTLPRLISLMVGRAIDQLYPSRQPHALSEPVLQVQGLSQPGVVADVHFDLHRGEILGMAGLMGSGRSELARILFGLDAFEQGEIFLNGARLDRPRPRDSIRRGMAFLTENRREEGLMMEASVADNIALVSLPSFTHRAYRLLDHGRMRQAIAQAAKDVRLHCPSPDQQITKTLSGGNQQKAVLAKWLLHRPELLILDEPTRGIDIGAKQEIYALISDLAAQGTAILFISSEIEELIGMCDRLLVMSRGKIKRCVERKQFDREMILGLALSGHATP